MARPSFGLPIINDLNMQDRVIRNTDWRWNTAVAYTIDDVVVGSDDRWYICVANADGIDPVLDTDDSHWMTLTAQASDLPAVPTPTETTDYDLRATVAGTDITYTWEINSGGGGGGDPQFYGFNVPTENVDALQLIICVDDEDHEVEDFDEWTVAPSGITFALTNGDLIWRT